MTQSDRPNARLRDLCAVTLGLTVPIMVSGRAVLQGFAAVALIMVLVLMAQDREIWSRAKQAATTRLGLLTGVAAVAMSFSIWGSIDPMRSFEAWARTFAYISGCVLFWAFLAGDTRARTLCHRAMILGSVVGAVIVLTALFGLFAPLEVVKDQPGQTSVAWAVLTAKAYAAAGLCLIPVLLWFAAVKTGRWRWLSLAGVALLVAVILGTENKSALAGLLAGLLVVSLAMAVRRGRRWILLWLLWAVMATAAILALVSDMPDVKARAAVWPWLPTWLVDAHRQHIWHFVMSKIAEAPWLGYGMNCIDRVPGAHRILPQFGVEVLPSHPHDWMFEVLAETGVIGFVPVALALGWLLVRTVRRYLLSGRPAALAQIGLFCVFWGSSLFNFSIWSTWWLIIFFLLTAVIAASPPEKPAKAV